MKTAAIEAARHVLEAQRKAAAATLGSLPGIGSGPMGLTPDSVKASPEYQAAKAAHAHAFDALRRFNKANPPPRRVRE